MLTVELVNIRADSSFTKTEQTDTISGKLKYANGVESNHMTVIALFQKFRPRGIYLNHLRQSCL